MAELKVMTLANPVTKVVMQPYVSKIAVVTDMETETSEVVKVDVIRIMAMLVDFMEKTFQANFIMGGIDTAGIFHPNPAYKPALFSTGKYQFPEWWDANIEGRTVYDFEEVLRWIHDSGAVEQAGKNIWNLPDIQSYYEGEPIPVPLEPSIPSEFVPGVIPRSEPPIELTPIEDAYIPPPFPSPPNIPGPLVPTADPSTPSMPVPPTEAEP